MAVLSLLELCLSHLSPRWGAPGWCLLPDRACELNRALEHRLSVVPAPGRAEVWEALGLVVALEEVHASADTAVLLEEVFASCGPLRARIAQLRGMGPGTEARRKGARLQEFEERSAPRAPLVAGRTGARSGTPLHALITERGLVARAAPSLLRRAR